MPYIIFFTLGIAFSVILFVKLKRSKTIDRFTQELISDEPILGDSSDLIHAARDAEEALNQRTKDNENAKEALDKDSEQIQKYFQKDKSKQ